METEFLGCPICYEQFNQFDRVPMIIPLCGHTICSTCLTAILDNRNEARCPLDKRKFFSLQNNITAFPINYVVNQILEERTQQEFCNEHNEETSFVCLKDGSRICDSCICNGRHKGHKAKPIKLIKANARGRKKEVDSLIEELEKCSQAIEGTLEEMKKMGLMIVKNTFEEIRSLLYRKEQDICFELNSMFYMEKKRVANTIGDTSLIKMELSKRASELANIWKDKDYIRNEQLMSEIEKAIAQSRVKIDLTELEEELQKTKEKFREASELFQTKLLYQMESSMSLKFGFEINISNYVSKLVNANKDNSEALSEYQRPIYNLQSCFRIKYLDNHLEIIDENLNIKESEINLAKLSKVQDVRLELKRNNYKEEDIQILSYVWRRLENLSLIKMRFSPESITQQVYLALLDAPKSPSVIDIDLEGYRIVDQSHVSLFVAKILSRMTDLRHLWLRLNKTRISKQDIQTIVNDGILMNKNLENLGIFFDQTALTDDDVSLIFQRILSLKNLYLCLNRTGVTDKTLELLANNTLHSLNCLEELQLFLHRTKVTDLGLSNLFQNLKNLKKFSLDLGFTKITDNTIDAISKYLGNFSDTVENFQLGFASTQVTDQSFCKLFRNLPNVKILTLGFSLTNITDKCIEAFVQNSLVSMKGLENLNIWLNKTKVTDFGIRLMFDNIPNLKVFAVDLDSTKVTDKSLEPFIKGKLPNLKDLVDLKMDLSNTAVSNVLRKEIESFSKNLGELKDNLKKS